VIESDFFKRNGLHRKTGNFGQSLRVPGNTKTPLKNFSGMADENRVKKEISEELLLLMNQVSPAEVRKERRGNIIWRIQQ
jgi:hypothetical protein